LKCSLSDGLTLLFIENAPASVFAVYRFAFSHASPGTWPANEQPFLCKAIYLTMAMLPVSPGRDGREINRMAAQRMARVRNEEAGPKTPLICRPASVRRAITQNMERTREEQAATIPTDTLFGQKFLVLSGQETIQNALAATRNVTFAFESRYFSSIHFEYNNLCVFIFTIE
jgi:hypothetical protein